jgi:hypothetical protein
VNLLSVSNNEVLRQKLSSRRFVGSASKQGEIAWQQMRYKNALALDSAESLQTPKMVCRLGWKLLSQGKPEGFTFRMTHLGLCMAMSQL